MNIIPVGQSWTDLDLERSEGEGKRHHFRKPEVGSKFP